MEIEASLFSSTLKESWAILNLIVSRKWKLIQLLILKQLNWIV